MKKLLTLFILITGYSFAGSGSDTSSSSEHNTYTFIRQDYFGQNDEYETPFFVFKGKKPGPTMILDGGIHGDEIASYMACDSIVKYLNLYSGTLIVIPKTNIQA